MNKIYNKILLSIGVIVTIALLTTSCAKDALVESNSTEEGCLLMSVSMVSTKSVNSDYSKLLENSVLKIYNSSNKLIRRYEPATTIEPNIFLIAGEYKATITAGIETPATFNKDELRFYGEQSFTIESKKTTAVTINCKMANSVVKVVYDESVINTFKLDTPKTYVSLSNSFSKDNAENNRVPTLLFTENRVGYFLTTDEIENISWGFYAESSNTEIGAISKEGIINNAEAATQYTLNFKYSKTPDGYLDLNVTVDESAIEYDDLMSFSPQPTIAGDGFDISSTTEYTSQDMVYNINSLKDINKIEVIGEDRVSGNTFSIIAYDSKQVTKSSGNNGAIATEIDSKTFTLTLTSELFDNFSSGGEQTITIEASAADGRSVGARSTKFIIPGVVNITNPNYWNNTGEIQTIITDPTLVEGTTLQYRRVGTTNWEDLTLRSVGGNIYKADIAPTWNTTKNNNGNGSIDVYTLANGISANSKYETRFVSNSKEKLLTITTDNGGYNQTIPSGDMEDGGLSCWGNSNGSASSWGSGNNNMVSNLCKQSTRAGMGGSKCAILAGSYVMLVNIAAGNLFLGQFTQKGTSGTVTFGQPYSWVNRPNTFKLKYSASLGKVDANYHNGPLSKGSTDIARIFLAIVDWSGRHSVKAGTSSPLGVWNPATQKSTDEGNIIGYAFYDITTSTSEQMQELELPIYYYDKTTKPSKDISIVISCATSAYGDYMNGSTMSKLWVDDFEFGY